VGNAEMLAELRGIASEVADPIAENTGGGQEEFEYRLICRRIQAALNSSGRDLPRLARRKPYNPAYMHPEDLAALGLSPGELAEIRSPHGTILGVVEPDATLRRGLVSMTHAFGDLPERMREVRSIGSNTGLLSAVDRDYDRFTGMPRMSNVPVSVRRCPPAAAG
jgi:anaerobic selenocysteine-containing dehydrogenase